MSIGAYMYMLMLCHSFLLPAAISATNPNIRVVTATQARDRGILKGGDGVPPPPPPHAESHDSSKFRLAFEPQLADIDQSPFDQLDSLGPDGEGIPVVVEDSQESDVIMESRGGHVPEKLSPEQEKYSSVLAQLKERGAQFYPPIAVVRGNPAQEVREEEPETQGSPVTIRVYP